MLGSLSEDTDFGHVRTPARPPDEIALRVKGRFMHNEHDDDVGELLNPLEAGNKSVRQVNLGLYLAPIFIDRFSNRGFHRPDGIQIPLHSGSKRRARRRSQSITASSLQVASSRRALKGGTRPDMINAQESR